MSWGEIKHALNSTLGTKSFVPLDLLLMYLDAKNNGENIVEFSTSGSSTVIVPEWALKARITACGGGGGGVFNTSYPSYSTPLGGGGGGAAILNKLVTVAKNLQGTLITVVVGAGGKGGICNGDSATSATAGGNTSISAFNISLAGGKGGTSSAGGAAGGTGGGAGGYSSTNGTSGISGAGGTSENGAGGGGGSLGAGGNARWESSATGNGYSGTRGGGGGAFHLVGVSSCTSGMHAGDGGDGYVKIEWFI